MERQGLIGRRTFLAGLAALAACPARAREHGWDKSSPFSQWVEGLKMPDSRTASCCGKGDFYPIVIDEDAVGNEGEAMGRARVLDGSALEFPDGSKRPFIKDGTPFRFPKTKVNPPEDGNPGRTAYAFLSAYDGVIVGIYCVIPLPPGV